MSDDPLDVDLDLDRSRAPQELRDIKPQRNKTLVVIGMGAGLVVALAFAYLYLRAPAAPQAPVSSASAARAKSETSREPGEQIVLPPLDETDALVRQLVEKLSSNPAVAAWLTGDALIVNFALVTRQISNGESPIKELGALERVPTFRARTSRGNLFVDPASYRRYDRYALAVSSLDARGTARLYATLKPRMLDAHKRMDQSADNFDPVLERAIVEMLKVPLVYGEVELAPSGIVYAYVDPRLETLSDAQKHLLRMGPKNVQTIQDKLREIADYLAIPVSRLPRPTVLTND